jgi:hypothetical protein
MADDIFADIPRVRRPPRPVNRTAPAAQALAGPAELPMQQPAPRAPQAAAEAGDAAGDIFANIPQATPKREVGFLESAGRTAGASAIPVVRGFGLGAAGVLELVEPVALLADTLAPIFGVQSNARAGLQAAQDAVFAQMQARTQSMEGMYNPQPGEEMSLPGQIAGGIASLPIEVVGGMGAQRGFSRAGEVIERGGSLGEAGQAGAVTGAANVAANLLPVKVGGAAARRIEQALGGGRRAAVAGGAATGAGLAIAGDRAVIEAENAVLPEGEAFEDLQGEANAAVSGGLGAALGALGAAAGAPLPRAPRARREQPTPGTKASAGAALADDERVARERAAQFGVELTKGQADRADTETRQFEVETAKTAGGSRLRQHRVAQNRRLEGQLDEWIDQTGAERSDRAGAGEAVTSALEKRLEAEKAAYRAKYDEAEAAGELEAPIDAAPVVRVLNRMQAEGRDANAGNIQTFVKTLKSMGGLVEGEDGSLQPGQLTIKQAEEFRKSLRANTRADDNTQQAAASEVREALDGVLDASGGSVYREARGLYRQTAERFKDRQLIRELVSMRKATPADRQVAVENVVDRIVGKGRSADQLVHLRDTLAGDDGAQAWREIQGEVLRRIRDRGFGNATRDIDRKASVSAPKLGKAIDELDGSGKLEILFGNFGAEKLRDFARVASDIGTEVKGVDNASNTSSALRTWARDMAINAATGGNPILSKIATLVLEAFGSRKERARVRRSLEQPEGLLVSRSSDPDARPFEPILRRADAPARDELAESPGTPVAKAASAQSDPRLAEIERLRAEASPEVARVLDERAKSVQTELRRTQAARRRDAEAVKLDEAAKQTTDPELRTALVERANTLRSEKIPAAEATELPPATGRAPDLPALPVGRVTEMTPPKADAEPIPAPETRELTLDEAEALTPTRRESELARLRAAAADPDVRKDLDRQIAAERKRAADLVRGDEYLRLAAATTDPALKADLEAKAAKLGASRTIPVGEAVEADLAKWRAAQRLGTLDGERGVALADALLIDERAARAAVVQFQSSPRAFDRQIDRIIEQGAERESQSQETVGSRGGSEPAASGSGRRAGAADGGKGRSVRKASAAAEAEGQARPVEATTAAVALDASQLRRANDVASQLAQQVEAVGPNDLVRRLRVEADRVRRGADGMPKNLAAIQRAAADMLDAKAAALGTPVDQAGAVEARDQ